VPPVTEGVFARLEPKLKIFLASNQLTSLPGELFNLDRLTVLSLRGNQLRELPPSVGKLSNLKELNLSQNGLRYLPYEILELFSDTSRLNSLHLHPNLFHEPQFPQAEEDLKVEEEPYKIGLGNRTRAFPRRGAICAVSPDQRRRSWHIQWKVTYQARTEVRFLNIHGDLVKGPSFPVNSPGSESSHNKIPVADVNDSPEPPSSGDKLSRAPSLLEVALAGCAKTTQLPFLAEYLPEDGPPSLRRLLSIAGEKKESGGSKCTICSRSFIIPRTEWIEWWEIAKVLDINATSSAASPLRQMENERDVLESMVPLMRRGCSWLCIPERAILSQAEEDPMAVDE
jgi:Leucine Rich repeats (2 copies)